MSIRIPPPARKEVEPRDPPRPNAAPLPPFVPALPQRQPAAQAASTPTAVPAQRQKQQQRAVQQQTREESNQQSAAARERLSEDVLADETNLESTRDEVPPVLDEKAEDEPGSDASGEETSAELEAPGGDHESGHGESENNNERGAAGEAGAGGLDMEELAGELLPSTGDDGIFEVTLPNGQTMGVAVNMQPGNIRFHLSLPDEKVTELLRNRKMELQGHLERRIQQNVEIILL